MIYNPSSASNPLQDALIDALDGIFPYGTKKQSKAFLLPEGVNTHHPAIIKKIESHLRDLRTQEADSRFVHLGVGGLFNFDIIAKASPDYAVLVDIFPGVSQMLTMVMGAIKDSPTPQEFLKDMESNQTVFNQFSNYDAGKLAAMDWLKPEQYNRIREMVLQNRILTAPLDLYDEEACSKIKSFIEKQGWQVSSIYTSNILEHALEQNQRADISPRLIKQLNKMNSSSEQNERIYLPQEGFCHHSSYQSCLPDEFASVLQNNLNILADPCSLTFITPEIPLPVIKQPNIVIEGKMKPPEKSCGHE